MSVKIHATGMHVGNTPNGDPQFLVCSTAHWDTCQRTFSRQQPLRIKLQHLRARLSPCAFFSRCRLWSSSGTAPTTSTSRPRPTLVSCWLASMGSQIPLTCEWGRSISPLSRSRGLCPSATPMSTPTPSFASRTTMLPLTATSPRKLDSLHGATSARWLPPSTNQRQKPQKNTPSFSSAWGSRRCLTACIAPAREHPKKSEGPLGGNQEDLLRKEVPTKLFPNKKTVLMILAHCLHASTHEARCATGRSR